MAVYKYLTYLSGPAAGSVESWYFQRSAVTDFYGLLKSLEQVHAARYQMCGNSWEVTRHALYQVLNDANQPVTFGKSEKKGAEGELATDYNELPKDTSIRIRFWDQQRLRSRDMYMAGCPRSNVPDDDILAPASNWLTAFNNWREKVYAFNPGWVNQVRGVPAKVIGYTVTTAGVVTVQVEDDLPGAKTDGPFTVRLSGINGKSELNGQWTAVNYRNAPVPLAGFVFDLVGRFGLIPFQSIGYARTYTYTFIPVRAASGPDNQGNTIRDGIIPWAVAKRQRGKGSDGGRGRQPDRTRT